MVEIMDRNNSIFFSRLITICPRNRSKDESKGEIEFKPSKITSASFIKSTLKDCIDLLNGEVEWMEIVPFRILNCCIQRCVKASSSLDAAPEEMHIKVAFQPKGAKKRRTMVEASFKRELEEERL